jgi:hypothetical protein
MTVAQHFSAGLAVLTHPSRQGRSSLVANRQRMYRHVIFHFVPTGTDCLFHVEPSTDVLGYFHAPSGYCGQARTIFIPSVGLRESLCGRACADAGLNRSTRVWG